MDVQPVSGIPFGYSHQLKTLFKMGKFPGLKSFNGTELVSPSLEHLLPKSKGGQDVGSNFVLVNKKENFARGNLDFDDYYKDPKPILEYINYFLNLHIPEFNGKAYATSIINTLKEISTNMAVLLSS